MMRSSSPACRRVLSACALLCLLTVAFTPLDARIRLEDWQTHTSLYNARTAATDSKGVVWVGTTGGVYSFDPSTGAFQVFRNIEALASLDISAVRVRPGTDEIYIGASDGMVHIYRNGVWDYVPAIRAKADDFASVQINDFLFDDDRVFIAGNFGITIFYPATGTFGSTITNFNGVRGVPVTNLLARNGQLWITTNSGVFSAPLAAPQFNLPSIWQPYAFTGLPGTPIVRGLAVYSDTLYAAADEEVWKFDSETFVRVATLDTTVTGLLATDNGLLVSDLYQVIRYPNDVLYSRRTTNNFINGLVPLPGSLGGTGVLFSKLGLAGLLGTDSIAAHVPNSPQSNLFMDMATAPDGSLWVATIKDFAASGFFRLRNGTWTNFTAAEYPEILTDAYVQVNAAPTGDIWMSSWGAGLALLEPQNDTFAITVFDTSNSPIRGISASGGGTSFEVLGETVTDARGVTWILQHTERQTNDYLIARDANGTFYTFDQPAGTSTNWYYNSIAIDQSGTKWLAAATGEAGDQIVYFNDRGTLADQSDDIWGTVRAAGTSLPGTIIFGMAVDRNGVLWLAGEKGLYVIDNPYAAISQTRLFTRSIPALAGQIVNCIMVDALNQKWAGTNSGVWILNEDGTEVLDHITAETSPLLTNQITSLATDQNTGVIYIGTRSGMNAVRSLSVRANVDFAQLRCYPQPFVLTVDDELIVEGLAERSLVKVATVDGVLVRTIDSRGSRMASWDGRDDRGELVPSGVYLISGFSETSGETAVVKAMVIRRE